MPGRHIIPRKSSAHRVACIALYRALLEQCPRVPLPPEIHYPGPVNPIKHFIRKRFKENVQHTSPRLIVAALKAGYAAEQLLRSSGDGNAASTSQIHTLLRAVHVEAEYSRKVCEQPAPKRRERVWSYPGAPKVLDIRPVPLEQLSGRRHPAHVAVSGPFPFLRFKKPQSPFLSRVLRDKLKKRAIRHDNLIDLAWKKEVGSAEAAWVGAVEKTTGVALEKGDEEYGWTREIYYQVKRIENTLNEENLRVAEMGEKMAQIAEEEKALAEEERRMRRHLKFEAKKARKRQEMGTKAPPEGNV